MHHFDILSLLIGSLSISLTSPEHLKFDIQFRGYQADDFSPSSFYERLRNAWSQLDSIATHPTTSRLRRVDINVTCDFRYTTNDDGLLVDRNEISKAVLDGLPLLCRKAVLFVKAVFWYRRPFSSRGADVLL